MTGDDSKPGELTTGMAMVFVCFIYARRNDLRTDENIRTSHSLFAGRDVARKTNDRTCVIERQWSYFGWLFSSSSWLLEKSRVRFQPDASRLLFVVSSVLPLVISAMRRSISALRLHALSPTSRPMIIAVSLNDFKYFGRSLKVCSNMTPTTNERRR